MPTPIKVAFVCVQNAGRSQMAAAFGRRAVEARGLTDDVEILTGGTIPADHVHAAVVEVMQEVGVDLSERTPREISFEEIQASQFVVTMGCSAQDVCPANWHGDNRDWGLEDPDGKDRETVRAIRDDVERRVEALLDELEAEYVGADESSG